MTGFTFRGGVATAEDTNGEIRCTGISHSFRIDHCTFDQLHGVGLAVNGFLWGVIDHCRFNTQRMHPITVQHKNWNGKSDGNGSWADDPYWGTERFIFIEDNVFEDTSSVGTGVDSFEGARFVVRYNHFHNTRLVMHGTEGQGRGAKQVEEYNNTYVNDSPSAAGQIRSGSIITHDNTWTNVADGHSLQAFRLFHKVRTGDRSMGLTRMIKTILRRLTGSGREAHTQDRQDRLMLWTQPSIGRLISGACPEPRS